MEDIYISSLAFLGKSVEEIIRTAAENQWSIEFSSGLHYRPDMEELYLKAPIKKMPHNYFPAPKVAFVLNLASNSETIRRQSIEHCKKGIWLAKQSNAPFFSAHAGFCIDPNPEELGKEISFKEGFDRETNKQLFIQSVLEVLNSADQMGVDFLIENNVIAAFNLMNDVNPLLCCESKEIQWFMDTIRHKRIGLLLDTAHLKVSCNTLHLNLNDEVQKIKKCTKAVHHSDNNGLLDNNLPLEGTYWFLNQMKGFKNAIHVIEVKNINYNTVQEQINLLTSHGS